MDDVNNASEDSKNVCPECGSENIETAKFCVECGQSIQMNNEVESICSVCGTISPPGIKFCPECGQNLLEQSPRKSSSPDSLSEFINKRRSVTQRKGLFHKLASDAGKVAIKAKNDFIKSVEDYTLAVEAEVEETKDSYIITVQLPNIKKENLDIDKTSCSSRAFDYYFGLIVQF